jgi:hypothetical protein
LKVNLTTNGSFPGPAHKDNVAAWAELVLPLASDVKISWNGATATTQAEIMIGSSLERQIENARAFVAFRDRMSVGDKPRVTMQLTFMRRNLSEIPDMVRLALDIGFDRVKGHHLWAHFEELSDEDLRATSESAAAWNEVAEACEGIVAEHVAEGGRPVRLENFHRLSVETPKEALGDCPFLGRELWLDSSGRLNVCCAPEEQRRSLGDFGTLDDAPLAELVRSEAYTSLLKNWRTHALCQGCGMRRPSA